MKKINRNLVWSLAVALFASLTLMTSCEGPDGQAGVDGVDGVDGLAGTATCASCHNESTQITEKTAEWTASAHGVGSTVGYAGGRSTCAACHSGNGLTTKLKDIADGTITDGSITITPSSTAVKIGCRSCHNIHKADVDDYQLSTEAKVISMTDNTTEFDMGKGNLCANCHQPRKDANNTWKIPAADKNTAYTIPGHFGPHSNPQAGMFIGYGAADVSGTALGTVTHTHNNIADACVSCHMGANDNHTMQVKPANCAPCHSNGDTDAVGAKTTSLAAKVDPLMHDIQTILVAQKVLSVETVDGEESISEIEDAVSNSLVGRALFNYLFVLNDKSGGAHNPAYTIKVLEATKAALVDAGYGASK